MVVGPPDDRNSFSTTYIVSRIYFEVALLHIWTTLALSRMQTLNAKLMYILLYSNFSSLRLGSGSVNWLVSEISENCP